MFEIMLRLCVIMSAFAATATADAAAGPVFSDTGFNAEEFGASQDYPVPATGFNLATNNMVGYYSHYDQVRYLIHTVARAGTPSALLRAPEEILPHYEFDGRMNSIIDYLDRSPVTGLLIARDDTILFEHYRYARTDQDRFLSQSMAKTITGLLVGLAVSEGAIRSIDDTAATYVPELTDTEYGATPLRALLQMSSGVAYHETYMPGDDNEKLGKALFPRDAPGAVAAVRQFNTREVPAGTRWNYSGAETEVLGLVVSRAVHMNLADYLSTRVWRKMGMESDAAWAADPTGQEIAYCCFIATLRDWGRLGLMLAHDGMWNGVQVVPKQWLLDATTITPENAYLDKVYGVWGYGYQIWLHPGGRRMFGFVGVNGQRLFVDPAAKLVMVQTAVFETTDGPALLEVLALWDAVVARYGAP